MNIVIRRQTGHKLDNEDIFQKHENHRAKCSRDLRR